MSIEYSPALDRTTSEFTQNAAVRGALKPPPTNQRRVEGKRRASRNAFKHGLCASTAVPSCEDLPTFNMFADELCKELNPQTVVQKILFPQIAQLAWNLRRFPEAQAAMFQQELEKEPDSKPMTASQLLARRFSDESANGFALLGRYERASQAMFLRLLNQFHKVGKTADRKQQADPEERVPQEFVPAISPGQMAMQELAFEKRRQEREQYIPPRNEREAQMDNALDASAGRTERSQSKPPQTCDFSEKDAIPDADNTAPVTKRTQHNRTKSPGDPPLPSLSPQSSALSPQSVSPLASTDPPSLDSVAQDPIHSPKEQSL